MVFSGYYTPADFQNTPQLANVVKIYNVISNLVKVITVPYPCYMRCFYYKMTHWTYLNTELEKNNHYFADEVFKLINCRDIFVFCFGFHWNVFPKV